MRSVRKTESCWIWTRPPRTDGYGQVLAFDGLKRKVMTAHRVSYLMHHGPLVDGLCVLHSCDTPLCVNPDHLSLGTHLDNMADMVAKGRQVKGAEARSHCGASSSSAQANPAVLAARGSRVHDVTVSQRRRPNDAWPVHRDGFQSTPPAYTGAERMSIHDELALLHRSIVALNNGMVLPPAIVTEHREAIERHEQAAHREQAERPLYLRPIFKPSTNA